MCLCRKRSQKQEVYPGRVFLIYVGRPEMIGILCGYFMINFVEIFTMGGFPFNETALKVPLFPLAKVIF